MSLSEQIQRVDGSQNDILKKILKAFGVTIGTEKIDAIADLAEIASNLQDDGILSATTKSNFGLAENATPNDAFGILSNSALLVDGALSSISGDPIPQVQIEIASYVGTGTSRESNPNSITFSFSPDLVIALYYIQSDDSCIRLFGDKNSGICYVMYSNSLTEQFKNYRGFALSVTSDNTYGRKSNDGKTFYWYTTGDAISQCNYNGYTYYMLGIKANIGG